MTRHLMLSLCIMCGLFIIAAQALPPALASRTRSRFREKYLQRYNDEYHYYTVNRHSLEDNDVDQCPDIEKSSTIFAITGQQFYRIKYVCNAHFQPAKPSGYVNYTPPESHYSQLSKITVMDIIRVMNEILCYTFEISMYIMSVILLYCSTIFIGIVLISTSVVMMVTAMVVVMVALVVIVFALEPKATTPD